MLCKSQKILLVLINGLCGHEDFVLSAACMHISRDFSTIRRQQIITVDFGEAKTVLANAKKNALICHLPDIHVVKPLKRF